MTRAVKFVLCLAASLPLAATGASAQGTHSIESDASTGRAGAVLVDNLPLVHTAQLLPVTDQGTVLAGGDARGQCNHLLDKLEKTLVDWSSGLDRIVRLSVYAVSDQVAEQVPAVLADRFRGEQRPAVSYVVTPLPHAGAMVALDAVAVAGGPAPQQVRRTATAAVMPPGARLYVAGQAEPGTLAEATRKTLASLRSSLQHFGLDDSHIVELKCFLTPMSRIAEVRDEIARHFGDAVPPPTSFVEWQSSAPIEIELVAWAGPERPDATEPIEFLTPPGMKVSPLYSRVTRINRGGSIFISGLFPGPETAPDAQVTAPFETLRRLLDKSGSDFRHLAKATYYVSSDDVSRSHNEIRPKYFDPARPPAASKAMVASVGRTGCRYTMDMIAVPSSRGTPATEPEHGHGLSAEEAAGGWISLFDGQSTFGWTHAKVENGLLIGGATTTVFGKCQLRASCAGPGTITVAGKEYRVADQSTLAISETAGRGPIELGPGLALRSLVLRPIDLEPLFDGRDLHGWKAIGNPKRPTRADSIWSLDHGALRIVGGPAALEYRDARFGDLAVQIDVRTRSVHSNGGVFLRSIPGEFIQGYEAQIHNRCLDNDPARPFRYCTGGIDDRQDARRQVSRDFETFRMTIIAVGPHLATWVNGVQVTDWTDDRQPSPNPRMGRRLEPGTIQIQAHDPATDYEVHRILAQRWD